MSPSRPSKPSMRVAALVCFVMAGLSLVGTASSATAPDPSADPAGVWPDLSGTWDLNFLEGLHDPHGSAAACCMGPGDWLHLTPKYRKMRDAFAKLPENSVEKNTNNLADCISPGVPGTLEHPLLFEFLLTPGRVTLIFQDGSVRRLWTDGRKFPKDLMPSPQGYSIGHWENRTLVVHTKAISSKSDLFFLGPEKVTTQTHVDERFSVLSDHDMKLEVTVTDPRIFTQPYSYKRSFVKVPGTFDVSCAADNRDNGVDKVDLTPPE